MLSAVFDQLLGRCHRRLVGDIEPDEPGVGAAVPQRPFGLPAAAGIPGGSPTQAAFRRLGQLTPAPAPAG